MYQNSLHKIECLNVVLIIIQWNLYNVDPLGTEILVLISEVSLFQGENEMCPLREVPLYYTRSQERIRTGS